MTTHTHGKGVQSTQKKTTIPPSSISSSIPLTEIQRAIENPNDIRLSPSAIQTLQRTHGNQFLQQLLSQSQTRASTPSLSIQHKSEVIQRLPEHLMTIDDFQQRKRAATTKKSKGDYKKLYNAYNSLIEKRNYTSAKLKLRELQTKIGRMNRKDYWVGAVEKADFLTRVMGSIRAESEWVQRMIDQQESQSFQGEISDKLEDTARQKDIDITSPMGYQANQKIIFRNQQRVRMISEALAKASSIDGRIKATLQDNAFISALFDQVFAPNTITFNGVLNEIATLLPQFGADQSRVQTDTMQNRIDAIVLGTMPAVDKLAEVGQLLWGSFDWYVNKDGLERDAEQRDEFILWLTDPLDQVAEPNDTSLMNCWEGVIFMIYKAGFVTKNKLQTLYQGNTKDTSGVGLAYQLLQTGNHTTMYENDTYNGRTPKKGDIVSIWQGSVSGEPHHVVLSLGINSQGANEVMSLWTGQTGGMLGKTTIDALLGNDVIITYNTPVMPFV